MITTQVAFAGLEAVVAHDELPHDGSPLPDEIVVGPGGASHTLLHITPRQHVARVWDLGCGSGVQSVIAARHADAVIATDIDQRCLDFTEQSAALSGVSIETRLGSLAEPVTGELFDLIVSNPPFVMGGATNLVHRESPRTADGLTQELLDTLPSHLEENGLAVMLTAWLVTAEASWDERIEQWLPEGCDAWVGLRSTQSISDYVDTWLADAGRAGDHALRATWLARLESWRACEVAFGWVVLRKRTATNWLRLEDLRLAAALPDGAALSHRLACADSAESLTALEILSTPFSQSGTQTWRGEISLDPVLSAIRSHLDGQSVLDEICERIAAEWKVDVDDVLVHGLAGIKQLVDLGLATPTA